MPSGLRTTTLTTPPPDGPGGAEAINEVEESTVKEGETVPPKKTAVVPPKSDPVTVTSVPPEVGPLVGHHR